MFVTPNVWMVFKAAKLMTAKLDNVERRMAECQFVIDPLPWPLAQELGESVASHLFSDDGAIRPELESITLDPRVPKQALLARGAEGVPATTINLVDVLAMTCAREEDEKSGREWIKATVKVRFDFAPKVHREWIAMYFGLGFYASFELEQGDLLTQRLDVAQDFVDANRRLMGKDGSVTMTGPDGKGVRITADAIEPVG